MAPVGFFMNIKRLPCRFQTFMSVYFYHPWVQFFFQQLHVQESSLRSRKWPFLQLTSDVRRSLFRVCETFVAAFRRVTCLRPAGMEAFGSSLILSAGELLFASLPADE